VDHPSEERTVTARSTRRHGLALAALAALACATPGPEAGTSLPRTRRVAVAPLNLGLRTPPELRGSEAPVWTEILRYLGTQDRTLAVVDASDAVELWSTAAAEVERSGAELEPRAVAARFAQLLTAHADYDILVMPSLAVRRARIGGHHAWWDGARRELPVRSPVPIAPADGLGGVTISGYRGSIAAASLYVAILGPDGASLYEGLAGLDVIQEVARGERPRGGSEWTLAPRRDSFADAAELREGVERAFARPLSAQRWP
jgi:hypothetical protein